MRKFLIVTVALMLVLGLSGVALAENVLELDQTGDMNFALVGQYAPDFNTATINQEGLDVNLLVLVQTSPDNFADVDQGVFDGSVCIGLIEQAAVDASLVYTADDLVTIEEKVEWAIDELDYLYGLDVACFIGDLLF